jgi:Trk K+ transport system NAD-binding subunit
VKPASQRWRFRKLRANWRDTLLLLREFAWPLAFFSLALVGGGTAYYVLAENAGEPLSNLSEAVYLVLSLTFFQSSGEFPQAWYLEAFFFIMPVIGIGILAQGVADFGAALFNRRTRSKEWEMAVASTFSNHIIVIGLGHLGFHVVQNLRELGQEIVAVEQNPSADLIATVRRWGIPVLQDDGRRAVTLEAAGVRRAHSIILCTQNDTLNLQIAVKARSMNSRIQVVVRIFDDDFAQALHQQFGFTALSATGMAAPAFASAAAGVDITRPITLEGNSLSLARVQVTASGRLSGLSVSQVEQMYEVSVVMLGRDGDSDLHPAADRCLSPGDVLAVLGGPKEIGILVQQN